MRLGDSDAVAGALRSMALRVNRAVASRCSPATAAEPGNNHVLDDPHFNEFRDGDRIVDNRQPRATRRDRLGRLLRLPRRLDLETQPSGVLTTGSAIIDNVSGLERAARSRFGRILFVGPTGEEEIEMSTWVWIVVVVVAIVVVAGLVLALRRNTGSRKLDRRRAEAGELRQEAQQRMGTAGQREAAAEQEVEGARREREAAEDALRRADAVDPDVPDVPDAVDSPPADR